MEIKHLEGSAKDESACEEQPQERREMHYRRRAHIAGLTDDADLEEEARLIFERYADYPDDHFVNTTAKKKWKTRKAFDHGDGWAVRLLDQLEHPHAYTLHAEHLGLPPKCADSTNFYCKKNVDRWKAAIEASFKKPLCWKLELVERVHVHIISDHDAGLLHLKRGGELVKPIHDYEGWISYLSKPPAQWNARSLALWLRAKRWGRLPRFSGSMNLQQRKTYHKKAVDASQ